MAKKKVRSFTVGSEWLYYKIYTGPKTADIIMAEIISPIAETLIKDGIIDKWFFIRYGDPKNHLRVRFHCPNKNIGETIARLYEPLNHLVNNDLVWRIQLDTYNRELERYGANTVELSETLFYHDSEAIVQFLDLIEGEDGEQLRWLFGLRSIDELLANFNFLLSDKLKLMDTLKTAFGHEFGMSRQLKKQLDQKFRQERSNIEQFLSSNLIENLDYVPIIEILKEKSLNITPIAQKIIQLDKDGLLQLQKNELIASYIHMLMNRLFKSKNRLNEMVCYDFLYRYYRSTLARKKK